MVDTLKLTVGVFWFRKTWSHSSDCCERQADTKHSSLAVNGRLFITAVTEEFGRMVHFSSWFSYFFVI